MIAAARRRASAAGARASTLTRRADRRLNRVLLATWPRLRAATRRTRRLVTAGLRRLGRRLRPAAILLFRLLAALERPLLGTATRARRAATRGSSVLTPQRGICVAILAAVGCLLAAQFVDYRAIEVGRSAYAGLPAASAPAVGAETAGRAHAYLLVPVALLAAALALAALRDERRRRLGRIVFLLGALSLAVALLVDLPAGLDVGAETSRFAGAEAVLYDAFYAEIAGAAGLMLGGMLLVVAHKLRERHGYRPRKPSLARTQGGRRRARTSSA